MRNPSHAQLSRGLQREAVHDAPSMRPDTKWCPRSMSHTPTHPGRNKILNQLKAEAKKNMALHPPAGAGRHIPGRGGPPRGCTCCDHREALSQGSGRCGGPGRSAVRCWSPPRAITGVRPAEALKVMSQEVLSGMSGLTVFQSCLPSPGRT